MASDEETVYCVCRKPYDENEFMIECDVCKDWFHGSCVGVQEYQASDIEIYHCPNCQLSHGPLVLKKRRNWHRHDYSEQDDTGKAVQTGTVVFIKELKNRTFPSADEIPIARLHGSELNIEYFKKHGFNVPIVVERKEGLGLVVPPAQFTIQDVENYVGSMREIDVIDVAKQEDYKMLMREWTEYYNSPNRHKVYNVISLEFSNTKLSELVSPPTIVKDLSWVSNHFPEQLPDDCTYTRPEVQKYCLMGVRDSFTDFHVDFGGTSVWYHILRGEKIFYLVRPTQANLSLYESWVSSSNQSETFFGDQVDVCYKCVVKQGQTLFIPTGWIHAVFTPIDSLVFGGNFLHDFNISLQLQVYDIERRIKTPSKYLFPSFETTHWYAAKHVLDLIKDYVEDARQPPDYLLTGAKSLTMHLKSWTQRKDFLKDAKHDVPEHLNYGRLLKDLQKEIRTFDSSPKVSPVKLRTKGDKLHVEKVRGERKKKKKNLPTKKQMKNIDLLHQHTTEALLAMDEERKQSYSTTEQSYSTTEEDESAASLKVRIPKAGAYLDSSMKRERFVKVDPDIKLETDEPGTGLKLKVSKGKIINEKREKLERSGQSGGNEENDSDTDNLIVDENPRRNKRPMGSPSSASTMKPGSLKLKLSYMASSSTKSTSDAEENMSISDKSLPEGRCGFSLCFDNVNQRTTVRHQSRDNKNKMFNMVQGYAALDRVPSLHLSDDPPTPENIKAIPLEKYLPTEMDEVDLRFEFTTIVNRILCEHISFFKPLATVVNWHIQHRYSKISASKSHLVPIGVLDKDESRVADTIDILEEYHKYVPFKPNGQPFPLVLHADGLSVERGNNAQNARINGNTAWTQLQGIQMNIQEWHKRCLLLQDIFDEQYKGSSGREIGTLFQLKNYFNHRNVTSNVKQSFNHDEEFLEFATNGYVVLAALHVMNLEDLNGVPNSFPDTEDKQKHFLHNVSGKIVDMVFLSTQPYVKHILQYQSNGTEPDSEFCVCRTEHQDPEMIYCSNRDCMFGGWFHLDCLGLEEEPDGKWWCSPECRNYQPGKKKKTTVADNLTDHKKSYALKVMWHGLNQKVRRDALRENDGNRIVMHWKFDLLNFYEHNHPKYFHVCHQLLSAINGAVSPRLQHSLKWNRTVNPNGGPGKNLEMDLQMEFFNKEYKVAGKTLPPDTVTSQESSQESETTTSQSEPDESSGIPRANLPTIQGGLNCSISDILEASGYGTETDFIVDNERTSSPSMRDAIQGMLTMSRMGEGNQLFRNKRSAHRLQQRNQMIMEEEAKLEQCYKDEEFIYPGLDLSDEEIEHNRNNKGARDDNWNPKARVHVSGVKGERPHREGVKKEAIEQVLAAAAAKPVPSKPKKPRKRLKSESFSETDASNTPGTALSSSAPGSAFRPNLVKPVCPQGEMSSPIKAKKPKKGLATAKQRLGKILKINKLGMF